MDVPIHMQRYQRGLHDIEHQITYPGSNFIFHDSQGFESGSTEELEIAWKFIEKQSAETELKNQLHAIWYLALCRYRTGRLGILSRYCIPMDSPCPILLQNLNSSIKGQAEVSTNGFIISCNLLVLERLFTLNLPPSIDQLATKFSSAGQ